MEYFSHDAISVDVAARLRDLREARGISIRKLAARGGLSANALSMIERGKTSPSISTLYKLAGALEIPFTALFEAEHEKKQLIFLKRDESARMTFPRGVFETLGGEQFAGQVAPYLLTLDSGASCGPTSMMHSGHEFIFCLRGQLDYFVEKNLYHLEAGDSLLFASKLRHRWRNPGGTVTNVLMIISGFDEGEDLGAAHFQTKK